jgi:hypothetical protein
MQDIKLSRFSSLAQSRFIRQLPLDVLVLVAVFFGIHLLTLQFEISLFLVTFGILFLAIINRGEKIVEDIIFAFVGYFGLVPVFGWINVPQLLNPAVLVTSVWLFGCIRFPTRNLKLGIFKFFPAACSFIFTYQWWKDLGTGGPIKVLSKLLPIWDTSAHFYFFSANLIHNTFIPMAPSPTDFGQNQWAALEYPTGVHYVWSRFVGAQTDSFIQDPTKSIPFFANAVVITFSICIMVISLSFIRIKSSKLGDIPVGIISFGIPSFAIGLGVLSQTITFGFVNIAVVLAASSVIASFLIKPLEMLLVQNLVIGLAILVIAYNWYPVILLFAPALLVFATKNIEFKNAKSILASVSWWLFASFLAVLPIVQTLSLGISHLSVDGGVRGLEANTSLVVLLAGVMWVSIAWKKFSVCERLLLVTPTLMYIALTSFFRITRGAYPYYFQKINIFLVLVTFLGLCMFLIRSQWFLLAVEKNEHTSSWQVLSRQIISVAVLVLISIQLFGYVGPDVDSLGRNSALPGITMREKTHQVEAVNERTARLISTAVRMVADQPINEKAWMILVLPERITKSEATDGSRIILSNIWFHTLSKSQTLTAWETSYVAANLETRGALTSDRAIANAMKDIFQPDSVIVFSTLEVTELLRDQPFRWKTVVLPYEQIFDGVTKRD